MKRAELKSLIKECLVEILAEGLGQKTVAEGFVEPLRAKRSIVTERQHPSNNVTFAQAGHRNPSDAKHRNEDFKQAIKHVTKDPIMASIFEDTAKITLVEQGLSTNDSTPTPVAGDFATRVVNARNPEQIFGDDVASKWAMLAFDEITIKKH